MNQVETEIIETATRIWTGHRRHSGRPPFSSEINLNLYWSGSSWYASCAKYPARTPRRFAGCYGDSPGAALSALLRDLRLNP